MKPKRVRLPRWEAYRRSAWCSDARDEHGVFECIKCGHSYPWEIDNVVYRGPWWYCARCDDLFPARRRSKKGK